MKGSNCWALTSRIAYFRKEKFSVQFVSGVSLRNTYQHEELSAFGASLLIFCDEQSTVSIEGILSVEFGVKSLRSYSPCFTRFQFYFSSSFTGILYGVRITFIVGTTKQHLRQF